MLGSSKKVTPKPGYDGATCRRARSHEYVPLGMKTSAYTTKATIARMIEAARASGLDVCGFETTPDGIIRIIEARAAQATANDFDRWQAKL